MDKKQIRERERYILSLWLAGHGLHTIAAEVGLNAHSGIARILGRLGVPARKSGDRQVIGTSNRNLYPCIVHWAKLGYTAEQITDGIGLKGRARKMALEDRGKSRNEAV